ncbi:MAG: hypothetical protein ACREJ6_01450 [Candidatus Methylomirabilis sp.]
MSPRITSGNVLDASASRNRWSAKRSPTGYVALVEAVGFPFLTADEVLVRKLKGHSIVLRLKEMEFS